MLQDKTNIQIRKLREEDLDWVIELGLNTPEFNTGTEAAQFYSSKTLQKWIKDSNGVTLMAEMEGQRTGFLLGYYMEGPNDGYINCIVVGENYRRKGIGKMLQESALAEFEQKGPEGNRCNHVFCVVSETDEAMLNLQRETGFEIGGIFHYVETMLPQRGGKELG